MLNFLFLPVKRRKVEITNINRKDVVIKTRIIYFNVFVLPKRNRSLKDYAKHSLLL